jgi:predicted MFS family arabinose efflux permease
VVHNATLRGLALTLGVFNLSWGLLSIAVPVLIFSRPHQGPAAVGFLWGALGAAGMLSALLVGRIKSLGRERHLMLVGTLLSALSIVVLPLAFSLFLVVACLVLYGLGNGPLDVGLITLRQRRTDPGMFGRAFAISMSLNWVGAPLGAALAGPLLGISLNLTLIVAAVFALLAAALALLAVPAHDQPQVT